MHSFNKMKKGVVFLLLVCILSVIVLGIDFTGYQTLDLPPPPAPPGVAQEAQPQVTIETNVPEEISVPADTAYAKEILEGLPEDMSALEARVETVEGKLQVVNLIPQFEQRLNDVEKQSTVASEVAGRIDALQSELQTIKVAVQNIQQRPFVEQPAFTGGITAVQSSVKKSSIVSISLSVLTLLLVAGMIAYAINEKHKGRKEDKETIIEFINNYTKQGYSKDTLRGHLLASGWEQDLVDEAMRSSGGIY